MIKNAAIAGFVALLFLTACSKQEPAAPAQEPVAVAPEPEPAAPQAQDYNKAATSMLPLLADTPECQRFHDELKAIAQTPLGSQPSREPSLVVAEAHTQGCTKRAQEQKAAQ